MNQDICLSLDSKGSLRNFSSIAVAIRLWEIPSIKKEIQKFGAELRYKDVALAYDDKKTWCKICIKVLGQLKALNLTGKLMYELENVILFIGDKIFYWTVYVVRELSFDFKHAQQIIWTPSGLIDETKIYQHYWRDDPTFPGIPDNTISKIALYTVACIHADEKFISCYLKDMASVIEPYTGYKIKDINKFKVNGAMTILLIHFLASKSQNLSFNLLYRSLKSKEYPTGTNKMFFYCAIYGFDKAAEYFYKKLKPEDKERSVFHAALECVNVAFNYEKRRLPEILLYLLRKIPREKKFLSREIVNIFTIFFFFWPYQNLCVPILDHVWNDLSPHTRTDLVERAFDVYKRYCITQHTAYKCVLVPVLEYLLMRSPESLKDYYKELLNI